MAIKQFVCLAAAAAVASATTTVAPSTTPPATIEKKTLNIHVPIPAPCKEEAIRMQNNITQVIGTEHCSVNFTTLNVPHLTLYMAPFNMAMVEDLKKSAETARLLSDCEVTLKVVTGSGGTNTYAFWNPVVPEGAKAPACLKQLSDAMVNATYKYAAPEVGKYAAWFAGLPADAQTLKKKYSDTYGSGNVFTGFEPHVTLQAVKSDNASMARVPELVSACQALKEYTCTFKVSEVAIAYSGVAGTVMQTGKIMSYNPNGPANQDKDSLAVDVSPSMIGQLAVLGATVYMAAAVSSAFVLAPVFGEEEEN